MIAARGTVSSRQEIDNFGFFLFDLSCIALNFTANTLSSNKANFDSPHLVSAELRSAGKLRQLATVSSSSSGSCAN